MIEVAYGIAAACVLVAVYKIGYRRAIKKVRVNNQTDFTIDVHVFPDENMIVIKSITKN